MFPRSVVLLVLAVALCPAQTQQGYIITTVAGGGLPLTPLPARNVPIPSPQSVAADAAGNVFFTAYNCVFKVERSGVLTRVAGKSTLPGYSGDGTWATSAQLNNPKGLALDTAGNLYIADSGNNVVRKVTADGIITTVAGIGTPGYSGDGGPAVAAQLNSPGGVALDPSGNLYVADTGNHVIRKVAANGTMSTVAGNGKQGYSGDGGPATSAQLTSPASVAADSFGNLYVADGFIRKVTADGKIATVSIGDYPQGANVGWTTSALAVDASGNLYTSDYGQYICIPEVPPLFCDFCRVHEVRRQDGAVSVVAGACGPLAVDASTNVYVGDGNLVREVAAVAGTITTIAGDGTSGRSSGDGGPAVNAQLLLFNPASSFAVGGVALDAPGNLYIAETLSNRVRKVTTDGTITTVAGGGAGGGDGGPATSASVSQPTDVAVDAAGNLYIAEDLYSPAIRKVTANGTITTVAGNGKGGYSGDGGPATAAQLNSPAGVTVDASGGLYISDHYSEAVRKVATNGIISTVAGNGNAGFSGDGGPATSAQFRTPEGLTVDSLASIYVADSDNNRIRKVTASGTITTVAGDGTTSVLSGPQGVAVDSQRNLYVADSLNQRVRKVVSGGTITTIAGNGVRGYGGDGVPATGAQLNFPSRIAVSGTGDVYVTDSGNDVVRLLWPLGVHAVLGATMTHAENFTQGQTAATYSVVVSNNSLAGPTSGTVTVTEIPPAGLVLLYMSGIGWNCSGNSCTRSDVLGAGASFAPITINVAVSQQAASQAINQVSVTGGGSPAASASDATTILATRPVREPRRRP